MLEFNYVSKNGNTRTQKDFYEGVITNLERRYIETKSGWIRDWLENYMVEYECDAWHDRSLSVKTESWYSHPNKYPYHFPRKAMLY